MQLWEINFQYMVKIYTVSSSFRYYSGFRALVKYWHLPQSASCLLFPVSFQFHSSQSLGNVAVPIKPNKKPSCTFNDLNDATLAPRLSFSNEVRAFKGPGLSIPALRQAWLYQTRIQLPNRTNVLSGVRLAVFEMCFHVWPPGWRFKVEEIALNYIQIC